MLKIKMTTGTTIALLLVGMLAVVFGPVVSADEPTFVQGEIYNVPLWTYSDGINVGTVTVAVEGENLVVTLDTIGGWLMYDTHLYVDTIWPGWSFPFPLDLFISHEGLGGVLTDEFVVSLASLGVECGDTLYISVHADLVFPEIQVYRDAWGQADPSDSGWEKYFSTHACMLALPSARALKESALTELEFALSFDPDDDDLVQAIDYLHMSLGDERGRELGSEVTWIDDWHVGEEKGVDTFQYEEEAIDKLDAYVLNDDNVDTGVAAIIDSVREKLYNADKSIAEKAIEEAEAAGGILSDIDKAKELYKEAVDTYAAGTYAHTSPKLSDVIDLFEEAWEKAVDSH